MRKKSQKASANSENLKVEEYLQGSSSQKDRTIPGKLSGETEIAAPEHARSWTCEGGAHPSAQNTITVAR